jgi:hypothetical protein
LLLYHPSPEEDLLWLWLLLLLLPLRLGKAGLQPGVKASRAAATALPKAGAKPEGRSDKFIAFAFVVAFAFPKSTQK